jgi:hypothetical protein
LPLDEAAISAVSERFEAYVGRPWAQGEREDESAGRFLGEDGRSSANVARSSANVVRSSANVVRSSVKVVPFSDNAVRLCRNGERVSPRTMSSIPLSCRPCRVVHASALVVAAMSSWSCERDEPVATAPQHAPAPAPAIDARPPADAAPTVADAMPLDSRQDDPLLAILDEPLPYRPPAAFTACSRDDECVVARSSCGADSFAVNRAHADDAKAAAEQLCKRHGVVDVLDVRPIPVCKAGTCVNAAHGAR